MAANDLTFVSSDVDRLVENPAWQTMIRELKDKLEYLRLCLENETDLSKIPSLQAEVKIIRGILNYPNGLYEQVIEKSTDIAVDDLYEVENK